MVNAGKNFILKSLHKMGYNLVKNRYGSDMEMYRALFSADDISNKRFYNIGAGLFRHEAWTNVDYYSEWYKKNDIGISYDLFEKKPLPIADNSANIVYSSHTIEHIDDESAQNMFNESYRILKEGGYIRLTTPDTDLCYRSVQNNDLFFWRQMIDSYSNEEGMKFAGLSHPMKESSLKQIFLFNFASQLSDLTDVKESGKLTDPEMDEIFSSMDYESALNHIIKKCSVDVQKQYAVNHINWWNFNKLKRMLTNAGFREIYISGYGQSASPVLRNTGLFDNTCPYLSIYVEARK